MEYHVSKTGTISGDGSLASPFLTIQSAADIALAGDEIIVHSGTYRECVDPKNSGTADLPIVYRTATNEKAIIKGSEQIINWTKHENIWKVVLENDFFDEFNPYKEKVFGDWFFDLGKNHLRGEVYLNEKSLYQTWSLDEVLNCEKNLTWYSEVSESNTTIWANFGEINPNEALAEINVRPRCFFPSKNYVNYITLKGFSISQAATNWAPPTAFQDGMIGTNWSKGWIIEENTISNSKCSGISLGKYEDASDNAWTLKRTKHGTQTQKEATFKALQNFWDKEHIGSHTIRNNEIFDCEQTGICGNLGAIFSTITNNDIHDICVKRQFSGAEIAGIKIHAAIDVLIKHNKIYNCERGLWLDWQAQGVNVSSNLFYGNEYYDLFIEVSHGPHLMDNNLFLSKTTVWDFSQGSAYVNNLFGGIIKKETVPVRYTPYHYPHSTKVLGVMSIVGGDTAYYNNIFINTEEIEKGNGLEMYNDYPSNSEKWWEELKTPVDYQNAPLPVTCESNLHLGYSKCFRTEENSLVLADKVSTIEVKKVENKTVVSLNLADILENAELKTRIMGTKNLGNSFETEMPYENFDGSEILIDYDFFGNKRDSKNCIGPFVNSIYSSEIVFD